MKYNIQTIEFFSTTLQYNVELFLDLYTTFINEFSSDITDYYRTNSVNANLDSFHYMERLREQIGIILSLVKVNKNSFFRTDHWEFLNSLEEINTKLDTLYNSSKWLKSSNVKGVYNNVSVQETYTLSENETLEDVRRKVSKDVNSQDGWINIAIENKIYENDYTVNGGVRLDVRRPLSSGAKYNLRSVVDTLIGERILGADISRKISFKDDDLEILNYTDTVNQAIDILITLRKGQVPEFPNFGIDVDITVGSNYGKLFYSTFIRQLEDVFTSDDTLANFKVNKIQYNNGALFVDYEVDTFYDLTIKQQQKI